MVLLHIILSRSGRNGTLLNKTKTMKFGCEKSKCRVAMCLKKNSGSNSFSSLTKTLNSPFEFFSIKICPAHNLFLLILLPQLNWNEVIHKVLVFFLKFLAELLVHQVFPDKIKFFPALLKFIATLGKCIRVSKTFSCLWKNFWSGLQSQKVGLFVFQQRKVLSE